MIDPTKYFISLSYELMEGFSSSENDSDGDSDEDVDCCDSDDTDNSQHIVPYECKHIFETEMKNCPEMKYLIYCNYSFLLLNPNLKDILLKVLINRDFSDFELLFVLFLRSNMKIYFDPSLLWFIFDKYLINLSPSW